EFVAVQRERSHRWHRLSQRVDQRDGLIALLSAGLGALAVELPAHNVAQGHFDPLFASRSSVPVFGAWYSVLGIRRPAWGSTFGAQWRGPYLAQRPNSRGRE